MANPPPPASPVPTSEIKENFKVEIKSQVYTGNKCKKYAAKKEYIYQSNFLLIFKE